MNQSSPQKLPRPAKPIAFVQAQWHADIVGQGRQGFIAELGRHDIEASHVEVFDVPGAYEIPLLARRLAETGRYSAVVACALVVDGGIYRHDFVADAVVSGLMRVQLDTSVPMFSVVLTPHHFHDHDEHRNYFSRHFVGKGAEAAVACLKQVETLRRVTG